MISDVPLAGLSDPPMSSLHGRGVWNFSYCTAVSTNSFASLRNSALLWRPDFLGEFQCFGMAITKGFCNPVDISWKHMCGSLYSLLQFRRQHLAPTDVHAFNVRDND